MNAQLIALMTEYSIEAEGMAYLFGVSKRTIVAWRSVQGSPNYRSMDRSKNKAKYKAKLKLMNRYFAKIRGM